MSGFYPYKRETSYFYSITIFDLKKLYMKKGYRSFFSGPVSWNNFSLNVAVCRMIDNEFVLFYKILTLPNDEKADQRFPLITTPCNFGGERYWFKCFCDRRIGTLYLSSNGFACRHCLNLTYESRKLSGRFKAAGNLISIGQLEKAESRVKRRFYNGKITRKYARFRNLESKFRWNWWMHLGVIEKMVNDRDKRILAKSSN